MISLDFLEKVEVFTELNDAQLTAIQGCCQEAEYQRGDKIFGAGEDPLCLWTVLEGSVDLKDGKEKGPASQGTAIRSLGEAKVFGWSSLVPPHRSRFSAFCASRKCKVVKMDRESLQTLFTEDPKIGYMVMSKLLPVIGNRFYYLQEEIVKRMGQDIMNQW